MKLKTWLIAAPMMFVMMSAANAEHPDHGKRHDHMVERMTTDLGLSNEQSAKIKTILETQEKKRAAQRAETDKQIKSVLNKEQLAKHEAKMAEREKMRAEGGKPGKKGCAKKDS